MAGEAIVVGSGAAGSVAAWELARGGWSVTVLERGRHMRPGFGERPSNRLDTRYGSDEIKSARLFGFPDPLLEPYTQRTQGDAAAGVKRTATGALGQLGAAVGGTTLFENEAPDHPATAHLDPRLLTFDEFYSFKRNPRPDVRVLLSIDESTYFPDPNTTYLPGNEPVTGVMGDHPMSWCHRVRDGRSFYTALGHEPYLYSVGWYRRHILGGILTAARALRASCRPE